MSLEGQVLATSWSDQRSVYAPMAEEIGQILKANYYRELPGELKTVEDLDLVLDQLDPYTRLLSPEEYEELKTEVSGVFGGLGVDIEEDGEGRLRVIAPFDGTPAAKAGLRPGDEIAAIDGVDAQPLNLLQAVSRLRGPEGTSVRLTVRRREPFEETLDLTITRERITIQSLRPQPAPEEHVGLIRIADFRDSTMTELRQALTGLTRSHPSLILLDLRNNPGGLTDAAVNAAGLFLPPGTLVCESRGRRKKYVGQYTTPNRDPLPEILKIPVGLLVNRGTAGATEVFAASLVDHGRALAFGERTHGKGSVQMIFPLSSGGAVRVSVFEYVRPSGEPLTDRGLEPIWLDFENSEWVATIKQHLLKEDE